MKEVLVLSIFLSIQLIAADNVGYIPDTQSYVPESLEGLTDSEKQISENYIHEGLVQEAYDEECDGKTEICRGKDPKNYDAMVGALTKAYTTVITVSDMGKISMPDKTKITDKTVDNSKNHKETNDYCKYIATATESISTFKQVSDQNSISSTNSSSGQVQKDTLYKAARSHKSRADNSKINATGWGTTTGCYAAMIASSAYTGGASSGMQTAKSMAIKLGASTLLTGYYISQISRHQGYADEVKSLADRLPGEGDCNPITERDCYCLQETTQNDPQYCIDEILKRQNAVIAKDSILTTCIDDKMQNDPECDCLATNTCYDQKFLKLSGGIGIGNNYASNIASDLGNLTKGNLSGANGLTSATTNVKNATGLLKKYDHTLAPPRSLSDAQRKLANTFESKGIPANLSKIMATSKTDPASMAKAKSKFNLKAKYAAYRPRKKSSGNKVMYFNGKGSNQSKDKTNKFSFLDKFKKKKTRTKKNDSRVLHFANKASQEAQINRDSGKSIFEIITRRYQVSGVKNLQD